MSAPQESVWACVRGAGSRVSAGSILRGWAEPPGVGVLGPPPGLGDPGELCQFPAGWCRSGRGRGLSAGLLRRCGGQLVTASSALISTAPRMLPVSLTLKGPFVCLSTVLGPWWEFSKGLIKEEGKNVI